MFDDLSSMESPEPKSLRNRLQLIIAFLFIILLLKLFSLQLAGYKKYTSEAENRRARAVYIQSPRGFIFDRNGEVLADKISTYTITFDPFVECDLAAVIDTLGNLTGIDTGNILKVIKKERSRSSKVWGARIKVLKDTDFRLVSIIEEHNDDLPGFAYQMDAQRRYPGAKLACHLIGYMGEISLEEYTKYEDEYIYGQMIGKQSIEHIYENQLKGKNGLKWVEVNAHGREIGILEGIKPVLASSGSDLTLTIDSHLQSIVEEAFGDTLTGAFVALDPRNGEVLVLASMPGFDPNSIASDWSKILNDPRDPLVNRAISGTYPPASTLRISKTPT